MAGKHIGKYLGREARISVIDDLEGLSKSLLRSSLVLLWLDRTKDQKEIEIILENLIQNDPLGITVAGSNAEAMFDILLEKLSVANSKHHIMTGLSTEIYFYKAAREFLLIGIPSEEMFDDWKCYWIITDKDISDSEIVKINLE